MDISIVIRNKNQREDLERLLGVLYQHYAGQFAEVILVDNESTDGSIELLSAYPVKLVTLKVFSFGGAINAGVAVASSPVVVLLSPHCLPVGRHFFADIKAAMTANAQIAGLRFIGNATDARNYYRDADIQTNPYELGLVAFAAAIRTSVWQQFPFSEKILASEDKHWTTKVIAAGHVVAYCPVSFAYTKKRSRRAAKKRERIEYVSRWLISEQIQSPWEVFKHWIRGMLGVGRAFAADLFGKTGMAIFKWRIYRQRKTLLDQHKRNHSQ